MALTPAVCDKISRPGLHLDAEGLYLSVARGGSKSWIYRYQIDGKRREMGLGGYPAVSLAKARLRRDEFWRLRKQGVDPLAARDRRRAAEAAEAAVTADRKARDAMNFKRVAEDFIASKEAGWSNRKHGQQWRNTLSAYAYPVVGPVPVAAITTEQVLEVLSVIWTEKTETAKRVQGRMERVLDYATSLKLREGENPARWRGHLSNILPKPGAVTRVEHQRALAYSDAPTLAEVARGMDTPASRALLLTLLCASRTSETLEARWSEIDFDRAEWRIPATRMKASREHRIPLTEAAIAVLRAQEAMQRDDWVFPGQKRGHCLSNMSMTNVLKRSGWLDKTTVHGLRSTFRDWVGECTNYPDRLAEVALAHQLSDAVQAAYFRADMMEKRRDMMSAWAQFLEKQPANVVPLSEAKNTRR